MDKFCVLLRLLEDEPSTNKKKEILKEHGKDYKEHLRYALDPFQRFHLTRSRIEPLIDPTRSLKTNMSWYNAQSLLDELHTRTITGNEAVSTVVEFLNQYSAEEADIFLRFLDKDLRCNVGEKIVNAVFKKCIPKFSVQLCSAYDDLDVESGLPFKNTMASRKLDGLRLIVEWRHNEVRYFSRTGKEFFTLHGSPLHETLMKSLENAPPCVLDGEVCIVDEDGNEDFTAIVKQMRKKDYTVKNAKFYVFDMLTPLEFAQGTGKRSFQQRYIEMNKLPVNEHLQVLKQLKIKTKQDLLRLVNIYVDSGYEGVIIKDGDNEYQGKRTKKMLKIKKFHDHEFKVTKWFEGEGKLKDMLGGFYIEGEYDGKTIASKVGTGFSESQRKHFWDKREATIGAEVTIKFFEISQDSKTKDYSLRFPVFKTIFKNKRDI